MVTVSEQTIDQAVRAEAFRGLHAGPAPFRLVNAWDAHSARVFAVAGAPAVGTSSFAVAMARGHRDGQRLPWPVVRDVIAEIVAAAGDVPVSADIEAGHGSSPDDVARTVAETIEAGAVGINLEDSVPDTPGRLLDVAAQRERVAAARASAEAARVPLFVNARCDAWFGADEPPSGDRLAEGLSRAAAYLEAGADGIFLPGLVDADILATICREVPAPVNVALRPGLPPLADLTTLGVRRLSQGAASFLHDVAYLEAMTKAYLEAMTKAYLGGEPSALGGDLPQAIHLVPSLAPADP